MLRIKLGPRKTVDESADPFLPRNHAGWDSGLTPEEVYEAARGWWVLNHRRAANETHAVIVGRGEVRLVILIEDWASSRVHDTQGKVRHAFSGRIVRSGDAVYEQFYGQPDPVPNAGMNPIAYF
jgi:hypothetical protein